MLKILHLSDIHLGTTTHGKINPRTSMNTRIEDCASALKLCIDRAIADGADLVLFTGDAFPDATPPPLVQQAFAEQFRRLADADIPAVLLVGNHDLFAQGQGGSSLTIYRSLAVPRLTVGDRLTTHHLTTKNGAIQVITLPWLTKSALLTRQETAGLNAEEIDSLFLNRLSLVLEAEIRQLDPHVPAILMAHAMVDTATCGIERFLTTGKGFYLPLSLLARPAFSYVALGHVHRHQCLCSDPPVVYAGSIERVDFSEEKEVKGYCWIEINKQNCAEWQFCPLPTRPFVTMRCDLRKESEPQKQLLETIRRELQTGAIARLIFQTTPEQLTAIDEPELHRAMAIAHSYSINPEVISDSSRVRVSELSPTAILDPISALRAYLTTREDLQGVTEELVALAEELYQEAVAVNPQQLEIL
jgi:exonuclease SbcD